jgi:predicted AAA+ superfamily ATPase
MWPRIVEYESKAAPFRFEFGLTKLPTEPGVILIRGPRQYGKSTWLDIELRGTIQDFGKGTAFYLNGDDLSDEEEFFQKLIELDRLFARGAPVRRIFVDEITAIPKWEHGVKRAFDQGFLRKTLLITTGSRATDLRRGAERLPGRKGRLPQTEYLFLPISYRQFFETCGRDLGDKTWMAYLLAGGAPLACNDIYQFERIPEYFVGLIRDWILGEIVTTGRSRLYLYNLLQTLFRFGGKPVGFAKLARESGLANNTVASGYIEQLSDLLCVLPLWQWDADTDRLMFRKPCKFAFINSAALTAFHPRTLRHVHEFEGLPPPEQGVLLEWLVAQELWRRSVLRGDREREKLGFWKSESHEIDFVTSDKGLVEVKLGKAGPLDFTWFHKTFPNRELTVVCSTPFATDQIRGLTPHEFLLGDEVPHANWL